MYKSCIHTTNIHVLYNFYTRFMHFFTLFMQKIWVKNTFSTVL